MGKLYCVWYYEGDQPCDVVAEEPTLEAAEAALARVAMEEWGIAVVPGSREFADMGNGLALAVKEVEL